MNEAVTIRLRREPSYVLVTVAGEIDIATAPVLAERLSALAATAGAVVVDLDQVSFMDAAGLGVLDRVAQFAAAQRASLQVVCADHRIRRLFHITGLDETIPLARTPAEAVGALADVRGPRAAGAACPALRAVPGQGLAG